MIDFIQVSKQFGPQEALKAVTFRINAGERIGIVGPNGAKRGRKRGRSFDISIYAKKGHVLIGESRHRFAKGETNHFLKH